MYRLGDITRKGRKFFFDDEAIIFENNRVTYRQLEDRVNRLANALLDLGYQKGDRLAILSENSHKYLEVYFAAGKLGMVVTPLNFRLSENELVHIATDSEATLFVVGDGYESNAAAFKKELENIRHWIALDNQIAPFLFYESILASASDKDPESDVSEDDLAILMYTGGTTGAPKGVMLTHRNIMTQSYMSIIAFTLSKRDAHCFILPLFHIAFWSALCTLMVGGKLVIVRRPELPGICHLIQKERCTWTNMVPTLYQWLLNLPEIDSYDLTSLRLLVYGGSPIASEVLRRLIHKFGPIFYQIYGMTESAGVAAVLEAKDHALEGDPRITERLNSVGRELIMTDMNVFDENDREVHPGQIGEIVFRGKNMMTGYWKNPDQTRKSWRNGWYHTGDMGTRDEDGYIYLKDRKADMIVTGGENVYPKEVENIIYENPAVFQCAVVSAPDENWGEKVVAVLTLKDASSLSADELIRHCKQKLAGYKCPKEVFIWEDLPKTTVGKILRREVKAHFWKGSDRLIG
ncbi:MAG: long-chain-fatty-acid--CoA ligase [Desulfobacterales bacterium]|jgi:acyl-CoA synthetase (AMP-forming)/AMP-acid ligase II|nr:long-chain-fatty-acid--CoA ligase [Desulfobacterales bacterium]